MVTGSSKNKINTVLLILLLVLFATVIFLFLLLLVGRDIPYKLPAKDIAFIDAGQIYDSNEDYRIIKNEIAEYSKRINRELALALAREQNAKKREQLKEEARHNINLYAETLLQDIDTDIENAIDSVADEKNLKRVYLRNRRKKNVQNLTNDVINELDKTTAQRIGQYLEDRLSSDKKRQREFQIAEQYNFEAYPVANVPEQGIAPHNAQKMHYAGENDDTVVLETVVHKFASRLADWQSIRNRLSMAELYQAKKTSQQPMKDKRAGVTPKIDAREMRLPYGETRKIIITYQYLIASMEEYIASRNAQMHFDTKPMIIAQQAYAPKIAKTEEVTLQKIAAIKLQTPSGKTAYIKTVLGNLPANAQENAAVFISDVRWLLGKSEEKMGGFVTFAQSHAKNINLPQLLKIFIGKEKETLKQTKEPKTDVISEVHKAEIPSVALTENEIAKSSEKSSNIKQNALADAQQIKDEDQIVKHERLNAKEGSRKIRIVIQFSASGSKSGIESAVAKMRRNGIAAYVQPGPVKDGIQIWRARVTAYNANEADSYANKLAAQGYESFIVR